MATRRRRARRRRSLRRGRMLADLSMALLLAIVGFVCRMVLVMVLAIVARVQRVCRRRGKPLTTEDRCVTGITGTPTVLPEHAAITFDDVAGLDDAKQHIRLCTILPLRHQQHMVAYRLQLGGGVLLWGPPGCGKTLLARAIAGELCLPLFHVRASDLMSKWVGTAEKNIAALFRRVRAEPRAVLFIDEIDALCPSRRKNHSTIMQRVISEFLSQIDGLEQKVVSRPTGRYLLMVGATNWPEALDEAVLRPGRFGVRVYVGPPTEVARRAMLVRALQGRPIATDVSVEELVQRTNGFTGADLAELVENAARRAFLRSVGRRVPASPISRDDFEDVLASTLPSISPTELQRYERLACTIQRTPPLGGTDAPDRSASEYA